MSQCPPAGWGRDTPRWSVAGQPVSSPALRAGLLAAIPGVLVVSKAMVLVGPPLLVSAPSLGSVPAKPLVPPTALPLEKVQFVTAQKPVLYKPPPAPLPPLPPLPPWDNWPAPLPPFPPPPPVALSLKNVQLTTIPLPAR